MAWALLLLWLLFWFGRTIYITPYIDIWSLSPNSNAISSKKSSVISTIRNIFIFLCLPTNFFIMMLEFLLVISGSHVVAPLLEWKPFQGNISKNTNLVKLFLCLTSFYGFPLPTKQNLTSLKWHDCFALTVPYSLLSQVSYHSHMHPTFQSFQSAGMYFHRHRCFLMLCSWHSSS